MAADRTVPCDHSIREESCWKAESVIGWSAAQRHTRRLRLSRLQPKWPNSFKLHKGFILQGRKAPTQVRLHLLHSSQASWQSEVTKKKPEKVRRVSSLFLLDGALPRGGGQQAEICVWCKAVWCFAESPVTLLYPRPLHRAAKNHKREIPQRKKRRTKVNQQPSKFDNSSEV